ncbi:unnamed protein product [Arctogadus glacialis]
MREQGGKLGADKLGADAEEREQGDKLGADAVQKTGADGKAPPGIMERGSRGLPNISTPVTNKREGEMLIWEGSWPHPSSHWLALAGPDVPLPRTHLHQDPTLQYMSHTDAFHIYL